MQEFNNDQMFFLSYAMFFCNKNAYNQKYLRRWVSTSIYAPDVLRVNTVLANMPEFAKVFRCSPGSPMNPEKRCPLYHN
ncbi:hypothetical protein ANCCAN_20833 [Ancylostoma caninum]|uniref:Peptidase M13 C-terminal domain-containing protein n=1 Tax=Ancylostoma caninum TaxID=29170 RepID=A0A368FP82_ANCCA|nr:hypothetical protein ANCCAN_20833 [Ancylostoma caninum]